MSILRMESIPEPDAPSSGSRVFFDSADEELKYKTAEGEVVELTPLGLTDLNLVINGGFDFAQLQTPGTLTTYSNTSGRTHTADGFKVTNENASVQYQRVDADAAPESGLLARFYGKFKKITSAGKLVVSQTLNGSDIAGVRGEASRFQVKLRAAANATWRVGVLQLTSAGTVDTIPSTFVSAFGGAGTDPTFGTNLSLLTPLEADGGTVNGSAIDCAVTTAWQEFTFSCLIPANCKNLVLVIWSNAQMAANDEINTTEWYFAQGQSVKDWAPLPLTLEQVRVQGILSKTFAIDSGPAQNFGLVGALTWMAGKVAALAQGATGCWRFPTTMRTTPTLTAYNPSAANAQVRDVTGAVDCTAQAFANTNDSGTTISCTGNAATTVGDVLALHIVADASI